MTRPNRLKWDKNGGSAINPVFETTMMNLCSPPGAELVLTSPYVLSIIWQFYSAHNTVRTFCMSGDKKKKKNISVVKYQKWKPLPEHWASKKRCMRDLSQKVSWLFYAKSCHTTIRCNVRQWPRSNASVVWSRQQKVYKPACRIGPRSISINDMKKSMHRKILDVKISLRLIIEDREILPFRNPPS